MRARTDDPRRDRFRVADLPIPRPGDADVPVQVDACGLSPVDAKIGTWKGMVPGMADTWVPVLDASGRIVGVGRAVSDGS